MSLDSGDTIVAIATASGSGAVGIVRVSGPLVNAIASTITAAQLPPRRAIHTDFFSADSQLLDRGIALRFPAPDSYTGEDVLELQAHGNPLILDQLVSAALQAGARLAEPGEFTRRAFLNDRIDLAQAEAVADLITSASSDATAAALRSLQGEFSVSVRQLVDGLTQLRVYIEATLDFAEEEIDFLSDHQLEDQFVSLRQALERIIARASEGRVLREGLTMVIVGAPNVGKSSLLNRLTGQDSAIVTEIAGTTRDVLREQITLDGIPLTIIDTAGLRDSDDIVEREGIRRAREQVQQADVILQIRIAGDKAGRSPELPPPGEGQATLTAYNKIDLHPDFCCDEPQSIALSAKTGQGIEQLRDALKRIAGFEKTPEGAFMARRRHLDALHQASEHLSQAQRRLVQSDFAELAAEELRLAQRQLQAVTGEFTSDDLLGEIFSSFCIGK
jgi:tRNA modification GTPase